MRERQRAQGLPPRYARRAMGQGEAQRGSRPYWRLHLPEGELAFDDLIMGPRRFVASALSDPVIVREDGSATYLFASAVDDAELGITHVIRGEDHVSNTALQLAVLAALDHPPPQFAHLPLIADAAGRQFSKRLGALSLRSLREQGVEPLAIVATLAALGTAHAADPARGMNELVAGFSLADFGKAAPKLVVEDLPRFSAAVLHHLSYADVAPRLRELGLGGIDAELLGGDPRQPQPARRRPRVVGGLPPAAGAGGERAGAAGGGGRAAAAGSRGRLHRTGSRR